MLVLVLAAVRPGSQLLVRSWKGLVARYRVLETASGIPVLALAVSVEELDCELPAALQGRSKPSLANIVGSALAFFLFNAGVVALVDPAPGERVTRVLCLPMCLATVVFLALVLKREAVPRWAGGALVAVDTLLGVGSPRAL